MALNQNRPDADKRFKVIQGILGEGGLLAFLWAVDKPHAISRFCEKFGEKVKPVQDEPIYAVLMKD